MGINQTTIAFTMIALFTIAILGFVIQFATDNNSAIDISDDSQIMGLYSDMGDNISSFDVGAESTYNSIIETTVEPGSDVIQSAAPFAITPGSLLGVLSNVLQVGYIKIFGTGSGFGIFITTFIALMVFIIAMFIIKAWKGNPD